MGVRDRGVGVRRVRVRNGVRGRYRRVRVRNGVRKGSRVGVGTGRSGKEVEVRTGLG